jgi:hypothetical protein
LEHQAIIDRSWFEPKAVDAETTGNGGYGIDLDDANKLEPGPLGAHGKTTDLLTTSSNALESPRPQAQAGVPTAREASQCFHMFSIMAVPEWAD